MIDLIKALGLVLVGIALFAFAVIFVVGSMTVLGALILTAKVVLVALAFFAFLFFCVWASSFLE